MTFPCPATSVDTQAEGPEFLRFSKWGLGLMVYGLGFMV